MEMAYELQELRKMIAELVQSQQETERARRESERARQESEQARRESEQARLKSELIRQENERALKVLQDRNEREINRVSKQLGELGNKWGSFTEGMAFPSMQRLLRRHFKLTFISPNVEVKRAGDFMQLDVFGYANGEVNTAVIVEVKSHLRERDVEQVLRMMEKFPLFFPEHRDKQLFGILAGVSTPADICQYAMNRGLYVARIKDDTFSLTTRQGFRPKNFQPLPV